jgi:hypothetical protein
MALPAVAPGPAVSPGTVLAGVAWDDIVNGNRVLQAYWVRDGSWTSFQSTYRVRKRDIGFTMTQVAVFAQPAVCPESGTLLGFSPGVEVKAAASMDVKVKAGPKGGAALVRVKVETPGLARPMGSVEIRWGEGDGASMTVDMVPGDRGLVKAVLPVLPKGRISLSLTFHDSGGNAMDGTDSAGVRARG